MVAGHRRLTALHAADQAHAACVVRTLDDTQRQEAMLVENIQREDLNPGGPRPRQGGDTMSVGELITWLTAEAAVLPDGLDTTVLGGVDDDVDQVAAIYTEVEVTVWPHRAGGRAAEALWVRGVARTDDDAAGTPA